ncbi:hypothetical protein SDRG_07221 [Saprolegnia diclina VS20]|uniref:Uncharacterized protein n=1 Tax=Saprolegnia diclina (strain VS20) TaxID=1156394 RepID=T0RSZ9_SAPDV|nr:hypothetical protein SDRG_07221 [Saprolegnia diclina VS20]EQC35513.1 hypothetical protein SDRG_07221 [Saprolegnia diclina VS20]|eukprot:XP_008611263.1 hypothetical protein SDRG_07221 [Saprolegnia diclina VS20]
MGNLGSLWGTPTDPAFYALLPPNVFDTEHYVYAECQRINLTWHVRPIPSGRTIASLQAQPNGIFAAGEFASLALPNA